MPSTKDAGDPAASLEIVEKIEKRGGFRPNSSFMHLHRIARKFSCDWCGIEFKSNQVKSKFCTESERKKAARLNRAFRTKKRLTDKARKSRGFRPPSRDASSLLRKARKGK